MDHWIPLSSPECPGTVPCNIIPLCHSKAGGSLCCNNVKGNRDPTVWLEEEFGLKKAKRVIKRINDYFASLQATNCTSG